MFTALSILSNNNYFLLSPEKYSEVQFLMLKKNLHYILMLLLVIDISYSFIQHVNIGLDGDMADIILPSEWYQKVLNDPIGFSVLFKNEVYANPNRFFAHWTLSNYFKVLPGLLQNFFNPIDSIYIACAIGKTAIQIFLILLLAAYISGKKNIRSKEFLLSAILVTPFFITYQYWRLGIIDQSTTFAFFYALPLGLLLLFFFPFYKIYFYGKEIKKNFLYRLYLILLAVILSFNGPLIPGIIVVICPVVLFTSWYKNFKEHLSESFFRRFVLSVKKIPNEILFYFTLITALCLYSLYIGKNNIENTAVEVSIWERYLLLIKGFGEILNQMTLLLPLIIITIINTFIILIYFKKDQRGKVLTFLKWVLVCSLIYFALLPLGGYRAYRPNILRYDTVIPVTLALILTFGMTAYFLIFSLNGKIKIIYSSVIIIFLLMYSYQDKPTTGENKCQRNSLEIISQSKEDTILISSDCTVLSWRKITDYRESETAAELLKYWGVTKEKKLFYQK